MARVTYGESITEYAGSIGGVTFLRNASGPIAKLRSRPPVNPSPDQSIHQAYIAKLVAYWPTLSQGNKTLWNNFAVDHKHTTPWGVSKTLSGFQWFISANILRHKYDNYIFPSPQAWEVLDPPDIFTLVADVTGLRCEWSPNYVPPYSFLVYLTLPLRQSSLKLRRSLFYVGYALTPGSIATYDLTAKFEALAGVTWATFYAAANCSIICRLLEIRFGCCFAFAFRSAIVKIG